MPRLDGALLRLILAAASWGLGTVISKSAVEAMPAFVLLAVQLAASVVALAVLLRWRGLPLVDRSLPAALARLGLLNPGLAYALSLLGLTTVSASVAVLLWAAEPILIILLAALVLGERSGPWTVVLTVVAVIGLGLVVGAPDGALEAGGVALTLVAVACCAVYSVAARGLLAGVGTTASVVLAQQAYALVVAVVLVTGGLATGWTRLPAEVPLLAWVSAIGSGILYYAAAYWLYLGALARLPASTAAASFYLIPVFGVAGGVLVLGESLGALQWLGAAVVIGAVVALLRPSAVGSSSVPSI